MYYNPDAKLKNPDRNCDVWTVLRDDHVCTRLSERYLPAHLLTVFVFISPRFSQLKNKCLLNILSSRKASFSLERELFCARVTINLMYIVRAINLYFLNNRLAHPSFEVKQLFSYRLSKSKFFVHFEGHSPHPPPLKHIENRSQHAGRGPRVWACYGTLEDRRYILYRKIRRVIPRGLVHTTKSCPHVLKVNDVYDNRPQGLWNLGS